MYLKKKKHTLFTSIEWLSETENNVNAKVTLKAIQIMLKAELRENMNSGKKSLWKKKQTQTLSKQKS